MTGLDDMDWDLISTSASFAIKLVFPVPGAPTMDKLMHRNEDLFAFGSNESPNVNKAKST